MSCNSRSFPPNYCGAHYQGYHKGKVEALKEIIRAWGLNPEKILTREAIAHEATTYLGFEQKENTQLKTLSKVLRDLIRRETAGQMRTVDGGPDGN